MTQPKENGLVSVSSQNINFSWNNHQQIEKDNFKKMNILNKMKNTNKSNTKVNEHMHGNSDDSKDEIGSLRKDTDSLKQRMNALQNRLSHSPYLSSNEHTFGTADIESNHEQSEQNQNQQANQQNNWNRGPLIKRRKIMRENYDDEGMTAHRMNEGNYKGQNERNKQMTTINGVGDGNDRSHYQNKNDYNNNDNNNGNRESQGFSGNSYNPYQYNNNVGSQSSHYYNNGNGTGSGQVGFGYDTMKSGYNHSGYGSNRQRKGREGFNNGYSSKYKSSTGYSGGGYRGYEHGKLGDHRNHRPDFNGNYGNIKNLTVNLNNNNKKPMASYSNNKRQRKLKEIFKEPSLKMILSNITKVVISVFYDGCMESDKYHQILNKIAIKNPSTGFFSVEWEFIPAWRNKYGLEYESLPITLLFLNGKIVNRKSTYEWANNLNGDLDENVIKEVLFENKMIVMKPASFYFGSNNIKSIR